MSNTVTKAVEAIYNLQSNDEINQVIDAIKLKRTALARSVTRSLMVGDIVSFNGRGQSTVTGRVTKVNRKTVVVKDSSSNTSWKVTASAVTPLAIGG
jgi:uncharacterized protein YkvS